MANYNSSYTGAQIDAGIGTANTAMQPGDDATDLGSGAATNGEVLTADGSGNATWEPVNTALTYCCTNNITSCSLTDHGNITTGSYNFFAGTCAGRSITSGSQNNFFGRSAGENNTTGSNNNFFGEYAGYYNTTGDTNNFFGPSAGENNTTGSNNNFFGGSAGFHNTTGSHNNFIGRAAGINNTTGSYNNFIGRWAGYYNSSGCHNNFFGNHAGCYNTTGSYNTFIGKYAGYYNTTGSYNTFIGKYAGYYNDSGCDNTFFGHCAGYCNTTGNNNLFFGCNSGVGTIGLANITTESNRIIMGNSDHSCAQIQIAWSAVSDARDKCIFGSVPHGRGFLEKINPITYSFKDRNTNTITDIKKRYGFSAQEILELEGDDNVIVSNDNPEKLLLTSDYLVPILVNAIKELTQDVESLKQRVHILESK